MSQQVHEWMTVAESAVEIRTGPRSIYNAIRRGDLKAARVNGRDLRIAREWLHTWAEDRARPPL